MSLPSEISLPTDCLAWLLLILQEQLLAPVVQLVQEVEPVVEPAAGMLAEPVLRRV